GVTVAAIGRRLLPAESRRLVLQPGREGPPVRDRRLVPTASRRGAHLPAAGQRGVTKCDKGRSRRRPGRWSKRRQGGNNSCASAHAWTRKTTRRCTPTRRFLANPRSTS